MNDIIYFNVNSLSIKQVNDLLDKVALGNTEHKKADTRKALQDLLRSTSALEQVKYPQFRDIIELHTIATVHYNQCDWFCALQKMNANCWRE